jgi:hypothetical protein
MKRLITFLLLFAAFKVAGQTTGYLRFDTVRIFKQNGTCELYLINSTKDSLGLLTNVGGGLTRFIKPKKLNDSTLVIGLDTISMAGNTQLFVPRISSTDQEIVRFNGTNGDIQGTPGVTANGSGNFTVPSFWTLTNSTGLQYTMLPLSHGYSTPTTGSNNTPFDYVTGAQTQSSGNLELFRVATLYNQTSTAGGTDFVIKRTETALGSGTHNFLRFDGGAAGTTERFSIDRLGRVKVGQLDNGTSADSVVVWDAATMYLKKVAQSDISGGSTDTTVTESPVYVKTGAEDTLAVLYDTTTITIRTTGVNDSALMVNTNNVATVQRLADSLAAHPTLIVDTVVYAHAGAESDTTTHSELIGKTVISLEAHPYNLHLATSYPPASDEVYVNTATGGTKFGTALQSGQTITWIYKYLTTTGTPVVEGIQVNGGPTQTGIVGIATGLPKPGKSIRIKVDSVFNRVDVGDSSYAVLAGVLRPTFDTATSQNTWAWISNSDHGNINIKDSVVATSTGVQVFYDSSTYPKVITFLIVNDETASRIAQTTGSFQGKAGSLFWSNGGYTAGASVGLTNATITLSNLRGISVQVVWNGSAWVMTNVGQNAINFNSTSPTISYSAGRLRMQNLPFNMKEWPSVMGYAPNGVDSLVGYQPAIEVINSNWADIYFWDSKNNVKYTAATPPTNFGVYVNFGQTFAACNPQTEDFGFNSNFWVIAIMKKIYLPSN